jgi:hypothetical protein
VTVDHAWNDGHMIEAEVVRAFVAWLDHEGWSVRTEVGFIDVVAERDGRTLLAEAKGTTTSAGLDVDTADGQLLLVPVAKRSHHPKPACRALARPIVSRAARRSTPASPTPVRP